jgi:transposase-like protein
MAPSPEVEVPDRAQRRRYTAEYKREILRRADACKETGALGALLRAEGLYSSHLATWRRQRDAGELAGLTPQKRGRKAREVDARDRKIAEQERQIARLTSRAERAEALVELQKKVASLLGTPFEDDKS